jgi:sugar lactone lactonase YvrE
MPPRQTIEGWLDASTLLFSDRGDSRRLRAFSMSDGSNRVVIDSLESLTDVSPSPDGRLLSAVRCIVQACELRVVTPGGAPVTVIKLPERFTGGNVWSPDSRTIAFVGGPPALAGHVYSANVTSGAVSQLLSFRAPSVALEWGADGQSVLVSTTVGTGPTRHATIQRVTLDGRATTLRDFAVGATPSIGTAIDAAHALIMRGGSVTLATLEGDSVETVVLPKSSDRYSGFVALSPDRQRLALSRARDQDGGQRGSVDIVRRDGSGRLTIDLPFAVFPGRSGLRFLGNDQLVLLAGPAGDEPVPAIYVVNLSTKAIRKLVRFPQLFVGELAASPDGSTVYYVNNEFTAPRVFTMDLSALRGAVRR